MVRGFCPRGLCPDGVMYEGGFMFSTVSSLQFLNASFLSLEQEV